MIQVIGIGMGLGQITTEAAAALRECDYIIAASKRDDDGLLALRSAVCDAYDLPLIVVPDPERNRATESVRGEAGYVGAVTDWHAARVAAYREVISTHAGRPGFLVWGDPALYDSTIRIVRELDDDYSVIAGISAPQLLAARHRIVLHEVGQPVLITTQRRLASAVAGGSENVVVMLTSGFADDLVAEAGIADWQIWWGANLGTPSERLVAGTAGEVAEQIRSARDAARAEAGWVMDLYLVRKP
ncbi:putative tetrapyrrole methylase family protein [Nocardioides baekrokdamisoli]|uniref:Putative tetrapyrrole methylase family protein n=1 Tax=Nocardioides baekrokdamisoli TaxID=1804624 RepID=A0A3G9IZQ9_9ACTN|nr:precorrin-6A synthase (deacetylating) [Nocardioides baekrokdamisoli]BBH16199.1 putative tetrapyrrole methylase family protein [Nocardioides baekrokdamisoli]